MGIELWGTYSTRDHKAPKAFVADVMLYDRLVIPVPAEDDLEGWKDRDVERQKRLVHILGDRARPIVWDAYLRQVWQSKWEGGKTAAEMTNRNAFGVTANVLLDNLPKGVTGVAAAVLFKSKEDVLNAIDWKPAPAGTPRPFGEIAAVIGREFLVPDDPSCDDFDLLKMAVDVSSDSDFERKRAAYWRWQREFFRDGVIVDKETVERAVEEMRELVEEEKAIVRKNRCKFALGFCFTLAPAALTFFSGDPNIAIGVSSAFLGLGAFLSDKIGNTPAEPGPAAMCYTVQREFGWYTA
jgi:hypothetical protein